MRPLPHQSGARFLTWCGAETDLIFNKGVEVPNFALFPLLTRGETRQMLRDYANAQVALAKGRGFGTILETATWMASRDRAAGLGYDDAALAAANRDGVALLAEIRDAQPELEVLVSANVGPRSDGYAPGAYMTVAEAEDYHRTQIETLGDMDCDLISGYTLCYAEEAIGIVRAAEAVGKPVVISLTVETDGRLPSGQALDAAIAQIDAETGAAAAYFMVNCAHPDHFSDVLVGHPRLLGVVVNASKCSHAELDEAEELDDGDPDALGGEVAAILRDNPAMKVFGGCCGTDMRHLAAMMREAAE